MLWKNIKVEDMDCWGCHIKSRQLGDASLSSWHVSKNLVGMCSVEIWSKQLQAEENSNAYRSWRVCAWHVQGKARRLCSCVLGAEWMRREAMGWGLHCRSHRTFGWLGPFAIYFEWDREPLKGFLTKKDVLWLMWLCWGHTETGGVDGSKEAHQEAHLLEPSISLHE